MAKTILTLKDEMNIVIDYTTNNFDIYSICDKYKIGKIKVKDILNKYEVPIRKRGKQSLDKTDFKVNDWKIKKYPEIDGFHYKIYDVTTDFVSKDIENKGGTLTTYIEQQYGIKTPTLYDRRMYYMQTGNYWWEQWLTVEKIENKKTKKCPYCNWETIDIENNGGAFEQHLLKVHNITKQKYLCEHPEDKEYFVLVNKVLNRQLMEENTDNYVTCKVCGKKYERITNKHLATHGLTKQEYIFKYGSDLQSKRYLEVLRGQANTMNLALDGRNDIFQSKAEREIIEILKNNGVECGKNRSILHGKELDIYIPEKKLAIEYNGNKWHTEYFGRKDKNYHLDKLNECNKLGIKLIQICEDEYELNKHIVISKIEHILNINNKPKIYARKCNVKEVDKNIAEQFLNKNHIQGFTSSTLYLAAFLDNTIVAVMTFTLESKKDKLWNLTRFASDINYNCIGLGGKLFKYFTRNYEYKEIKSFADRRWTTMINNNLYTKLGFKLDKILKPNYHYYNESINRYERFHKFNFRKSILCKKYNIDENLTEEEIMKQLGYDRIWDCGLVKYVYTNPNM